jgi:hypothetical protein
MSRGTYGVRDWLQRASAAIPPLEAQNDRCARTIREVNALERRLSDEVPERFEGMLLDLLPDLSPASLQRAANSTGALGGADPEAMVEERRKEIGAEMAEIRADVDVPQVPERLEQLVVKIEDFKKELHPLRRFLRSTRHERLDHLLEVGYGTPEYDVPWWRVSYYSDWKAGDEILEAVAPEFEDFAAFRIGFAQRYNEAEVIEPKLEQAIEAQNILTSTLERYTKLEHSLSQVPTEVLLELRETLGTFLGARKEAAFENRMNADPSGRAVALGWVGANKRLQYLRELERESLQPFAAAIHKSLDKLRRKSVKYRRPKKAHTRFSHDEIERTFADRSHKWEKFWTRFDAAFAALKDFDDRYHYGRFEDDFLWWDLFCDGRVKGRFSEEVVEFYEEHDDYSWESPWEDEDDYEWEESHAAAAVAEADGYDEGELWDGS